LEAVFVAVRVIVTEGVTDGVPDVLAVLEAVLDAVLEDVTGLEPVLGAVSVGVNDDVPDLLGVSGDVTEDVQSWNWIDIPRPTEISNRQFIYLCVIPFSSRYSCQCCICE